MSLLCVGHCEAPATYILEERNGNYAAMNEGMNDYVYGKQWLEKNMYTHTPNHTLNPFWTYLNTYKHEEVANLTISSCSEVAPCPGWMLWHQSSQIRFGNK